MKLLSLLAATSFLLVAHATSQTSPDGPYWNITTAPANLVSVTTFGTHVTVRTTTDVRLWSGITRTWTTIPISGPAATVTIFNAYVLVQDGNLLHGWTTRVTDVDTLILDPGAQITSGPTTSSWVSVVVQNSVAYGFSAFRGDWVPQPLVSATPNVVASGVTAIVDDGVNGYGFGTDVGAWSSVPSAPGATVLVSGDYGLLILGNLVNGYSSPHSAWSSTTVSNASAPAIARGFAAFVDGATVEIYSGERNGFAQATAPSGMPLTFLTDNNVGAFVDGNELYAYSALTNDFASVTTIAPANIQLDADFVIGNDGVALYGYSAIFGTFAPTFFGGFTVTTNETIAVATDGTDYWGYSPLFHGFLAAPTGFYTSVVLQRSLAVLVEPNGYTALSSRFPQWQHLATSPGGSFVGPSAHNVFIAQDGPTWHAFDTRLGRWAATTFAGSNPAGNIFRTVAIYQDGVDIHGYGLMHNTWEVVPLQGTVTQTSVASSIGAVVTTSHIYCFTPHGSLSNPTRYPEFTRFLARGTNLRLLQTGQAGTLVITAFGLAPDYAPLGVFGTAFVNLAHPSTIFMPMGNIPATGILDTEIFIPDVPFLSGVTLFMQSILVTPVGGLHLTNSTSPIIV